MKRFFTIMVTGAFLVLLWGVLFGYKTCACGEKLSLADRAVQFVRGH
jgi:hypothetical protein